MWRSLFLTVTVLTVLAVMAGAQEDETTKPSSQITQQAEALIRARCSLCHTPDLIYQQRLPEERWRATVDKMMRWGADLSTEEAAALVNAPGGLRTLDVARVLHAVGEDQRGFDAGVTELLGERAGQYIYLMA